MGRILVSEKITSGPRIVDIASSILRSLINLLQRDVHVVNVEIASNGLVTGALFFFSPPLVSRFALSLALRKMPRSPLLDHKAPVMRARNDTISSVALKRVSSYRRMLYHSISTLIIFCHFLINSVTKPFSSKMTENNQSFFSFFSIFWPIFTKSKNHDKICKL